MLKEGHRHYAGLEEAILRNIEACREVSKITKSSFGPNGMKKMILNHIDKIFVTNDAATILKEAEVHHPAAAMLAMAAKMQKEDYGDCTNYVMTFAGELLSKAQGLIQTGLHPSVIIKGYEIALKECLRLLEEKCVGWKVEDHMSKDSAKTVIKTVLGNLKN
jgi:T-complex protein 1 subunit theta